LKSEESILQQTCVKWFRYHYPQHQRFLVGIPNEGQRTPKNGARMKAQGMIAGISDLILFDPESVQMPIFLECKTQKGRQSQSQKEFEAEYTEAGYKYYIFRSFDEFRELVNNYLQ